MSPTGVDLPTLLGHLGNFLSQHGYPVRSATLGQASASIPRRGGESLPGQLFLGPDPTRALWKVAARYGRRGRLDQRQVGALGVATHELLHQMRYGRTPEVYNDPQNAYWEEAATEAAAQDLLPIMLQKLFGYRMAPPTGNAARDSQTAYPTRVRKLRQLSTFASGSPNYNAHGARVWRRKFSHADAAGRTAMLGEARAAKAKAMLGRPAPKPRRARVLPGGPDRLPR